MKTYETSARVEDQGEVRVAGVPFAPGTEVEVAINPKRRPGEEFAAAWQRLCTDLRGRAGVKDVTDEEISEEIDRFRAGQ